MAKGKKTGGRTAGTPNRKTQAVMELLDSLDCNPILGMARIAINEKTTLELRGRMYSELAQYVYPKRRAVEMSAEEGQGAITISWGPPLKLSEAGEPVLANGRVHDDLGNGEPVTYNGNGKEGF